MTSRPLCPEHSEPLVGGTCPTCDALEITKDDAADDDAALIKLAARLMAELHLGPAQAKALARQLLANEAAAAATGEAGDEHDASVRISQKPRPQGRQF